MDQATARRRMLAQMDWLMLPFAVFYLMLAVLAVAVWVLRRDDVDLRAMKQPQRRAGQRVISGRTNARNGAEDRARRRWFACRSGRAGSLMGAMASGEWESLVGLVIAPGLEEAAAELNGKPGIV